VDIYTQPPGYTYITFYVVGAAGGSLNGRNGGLGAALNASYRVDPGTRVYLSVGGINGFSGDKNSTYLTNFKAINAAGGSGSSNGAKGGGCSWVSLAPFGNFTSPNVPVLIAGGGGGAGFYKSPTTGATEYFVGGNAGIGTNTNTQKIASAGVGTTTTTPNGAGGAGGMGTSGNNAGSFTSASAAGTAGAYLKGGNGFTGTASGGSGGGGCGYRGGGGGAYAGGGGGSSYCSSSGCGALQWGNANSNGQIIIVSWS